MPLPKLRAIPKLAKAIFQNPPPHSVLIKHLTNAKLKYPLNPEFVKRIESEQPPKLSSGFEYPIGGTEKLPFHVARTKSGSLPVYIDYRNGRTKAVTIVRKISGDVRQLQADMLRVCQQDVIQKQGRLEVKGNHVRVIRLWLRGLGF